MSMVSAMDDRRDGVEEGERVLAGQRADRLGQRRRGERAGGDDDAVPVGRRQAVDLLAHGSSTSGSAASARLDRGGEAVAVDRERAARRQLVRVGGAHDQRAAAPHLLVQQADGVVLGIVGAERVGADQLGQPSVRCASVPRSGRISCSTTGTPAGRLPGRLAAGEAAADDVDGRRAFSRRDRARPARASSTLPPGTPGPIAPITRRRLDDHGALDRMMRTGQASDSSRLFAAHQLAGIVL